MGRRQFTSIYDPAAWLHVTFSVNQVQQREWEVIHGLLDRCLAEGVLQEDTSVGSFAIADKRGLVLADGRRAVKVLVEARGKVFDSSYVMIPTRGHLRRWAELAAEMGASDTTFLSRSLEEARLHLYWCPVCARPNPLPPGPRCGWCHSPMAANLLEPSP